MWVGCSEDKEELPPPGPDVYDIIITALLHDTEGNDLFDPSTPGYINPDSIWIEPGVGSDLTPYFLLQRVPNYFAQTWQGINCLSFAAMSFSKDGSYTLDYIHWSDDWVDTLRCGLRPGVIITDIYVNGKLTLPEEDMEQLGRAIIFVRPEKE